MSLHCFVSIRSQNKRSNTCSNITAALQRVYICVVMRHCAAMASVSACRNVGQPVRCGHRELKCRLPGCQTVGLSDSQTVRLSEYQTVQLSDSSSHCQNIKLSECQHVKMSDFFNVTLSDLLTVILSDCKTVNLSEFQTIGLLDCLTV